MFWRWPMFFSAAGLFSQVCISLASNISLAHMFSRYVCVLAVSNAGTLMPRQSFCCLSSSRAYLVMWDVKSHSTLNASSACFFSSVLTTHH